MLLKIKTNKKITKLLKIKVKEKIRLKCTKMYEMLLKVRVGLKIITKVIVKMPLTVKAGKTIVI